VAEERRGKKERDKETRRRGREKTKRVNLEK